MDEPWTATEQLLIAICDELDLVGELVANASAEQNFGEMANRLREAATLAEAGEILTRKS